MIKIKKNKTKIGKTSRPCETDPYSTQAKGKHIVVFVVALTCVVWYFTPHEAIVVGGGKKVSIQILCQGTLL